MLSGQTVTPYLKEQFDILGILLGNSFAFCWELDKKIDTTLC